MIAGAWSCLSARPRPPSRANGILILLSLSLRPADLVMNPVAKNVTKYTRTPSGRAAARKQPALLENGIGCQDKTVHARYPKGELNRPFEPFFACFWTRQDLKTSSHNGRRMQEHIADRSTWWSLRLVRGRQGGIVVSTTTGKFAIYPENACPGRGSAWKRTL
jgi:hypothetical protein